MSCVVPPINVLIKPVSSECNLRCEYCFYHDESEKRDIRSFGVMKDETIEKIIKKTLAYATYSCTFGFQGGEPTLAGLDFFRKVVALQRKYNKKKLIIYNALQTNGTLISEEWAVFLANEKFLVGVSLDGNEGLHNLYRRDMQKKGTFNKIMTGIKILKEHGVNYNILTVVTAQTAKSIKRVYSFFMRTGLKYQQYIPCLNPIGETNKIYKYTLTPELYGKFLKDLFDRWYIDRINNKFVYIRYFENLAAIMLGLKPESCDMNGICSIQYAFEANGNVYPCDFYMLDDYYIGNINVDDIEIIDKNREKIGFIQLSARLAEECYSCKWMPICRGGCRRHREQDGTGLNYFCKSYKEFFEYALPRMKNLIT